MWGSLKDISCDCDQCCLPSTLRKKCFQIFFLPKTRRSWFLLCGRQPNAGLSNCVHLRRWHDKWIASNRVLNAAETEIGLRLCAYKVQTISSNITYWARANNLKLNSAKCCEIIISLPTSDRNLPPPHTRLVVKSSQSESKCKSKSSRHKSKSKSKSSPLKSKSLTFESKSKSKSGIQCPNQCFCNFKKNFNCNFNIIFFPTK